MSEAKPTPAETEEAAEHEEELLDEALEESFPSSDPIAVSITKEALNSKAGHAGQR